MSEPIRKREIKQLGDRAHELAKLREHPSWQTLVSEFETRKQFYLLRLARELAAGGPNSPPLNEQELNYQRGFLRGAQAILETPENAIAQLEKALRKESA